MFLHFSHFPSLLCTVPFVATRAKRPLDFTNFHHEPPAIPHLSRFPISIFQLESAWPGVLPKVPCPSVTQGTAPARSNFNFTGKRLIELFPGTLPLDVAAASFGFQHPRFHFPGARPVLPALLFEGFLSARLRLPGAIIQGLQKAFARQLTVLKLRARFLDGHRYPGGKVPQGHLRRGLVHVLAPGSGGAIKRFFQVRFVQFSNGHGTGKLVPAIYPSGSSFGNPRPVPTANKHVAFHRRQGKLHPMFSRRFCCSIALLSALLAPAFASAEVVTNRFGFVGPEIFPIENQISQLKSADLDGDGLQDLVVVNNARSKISLLYNRTGQTNTEPSTEIVGRPDINDLPPDARFKLESVASEKRISSMVVADLNNDDRPDIAYYGEPRELIVQYNEGTNKWSALKRIPIDDGTLDPYALVHGDLNGDELTDLLLLADAQIYFLPQTKENTLGEPEKIPYIGAVKSLQILDIQGDGRDDLLLVNWDNPNPFRFRLQNEAGKLGPEIHFTLPPIRSYWADDLDNDKKTEVVTIAQKSGRAQISGFVRREAEELSGEWKQGQFQIMPLRKTSKTRRGILWADLDGDKRSDLVVAEPDSGQITLSLQNTDGSFRAPQTFATLTGITDLLAGDWNDDGKADLFLLSNDERQIGVTRLDDKGGLGFPEILHSEGRPLAFAFGEIQEKQTLAVVVDLDGKRELHLRRPEAEPKKQKLSESFKANPSSIVMHDVNQDGLADLVVLIPYEKMKILLQVEDKDFEEIDVSAPGGSTDQPWVSSADVDGDGKAELLLPQKNFIRAVVLKRQGESSNWNFQVKEQINGATSNSRIIAATPLLRTGEIPALFLLDAERKALTLSERSESGTWEVVRNISLPVTDFNSAAPIALGGSDLSAVSLIGLNSVAWLDLAGEVWAFQELDGYETPIRDGFLHDVVSGDLNQDGRRDLVFLETGKSYLDLVTFEEPHNLVPANRWQVFEERTFRSRRNELAEPREALITDLTGDGKNDLAVVVHDRVLVYPQE